MFHASRVAGRAVTGIAGIGIVHAQRRISGRGERVGQQPPRLVRVQGIAGQTWAQDDRHLAAVPLAARMQPSEAIGDHHRAHHGRLPRVAVMFAMPVGPGDGDITCSIHRTSMRVAVAGHRFAISVAPAGTDGAAMMGAPTDLPNRIAITNVQRPS
jgi:hypothetical protein